MQNTQPLFNQVTAAPKAFFQSSCPERLEVELNHVSQNLQTAKMQEHPSILRRYDLNLKRKQTKNTCSRCYSHHNCHRELEARLKCPQKPCDCAPIKFKGDILRNKTNVRQALLPTSAGNVSAGSCSGNSGRDRVFVSAGVWSTDNGIIASSSCNGLHKSHKTCTSWTVKEIPLGKWFLSKPG